VLAALTPAAEDCAAGLAVCAAGHATGGRTNDLLMLELSAWSWSQPSTSGTAPSPRSGAALTLGNGHYLIIHGGRNNFVLDDMHVLDLLTRTWIEVGRCLCVVDGSWAWMPVAQPTVCFLAVGPARSMWGSGLKDRRDSLT
jgi:hypothetical protein